MSGNTLHHKCRAFLKTEVATLLYESQPWLDLLKEICTLADIPTMQSITYNFTLFREDFRKLLSSAECSDTISDLETLKATLSATAKQASQAWQNYHQRATNSHETIEANLKILHIHHNDSDVQVLQEQITEYRKRFLHESHQVMEQARYGIRQVESNLQLWQQKADELIKAIRNTHTAQKIPSGSPSFLLPRKEVEEMLAQLKMPDNILHVCIFL